MAALDLMELEQAIRSLCEPLGKTRRIDLIPHAEGGCIVCRVEPASPGDHEAFVDQFGGAFIGRGVYFNIPNNSFEPVHQR